MEISEIIESVDILEYISQFCDLSEKQDGEFWGLSPLKDEKTPSFSVNVQMQRFYDFSSGKGGNVLDFICQYNGCDFKKGLKILKEYANIIDNGTSATPKRMSATYIAKRYQVKSPKKKVSKSVALSPDYMNRYERNAKKLAVWEQEGLTPESMERFQVRYDSFSDRLVYPIKDLNGNIINIGGRTLDPRYKEKRLRKYTYFKPFGILDTIYGLSDNRKYIMECGEVILFEGAKSVMIADGWGIKNTGAILTSHLNQYQFRILIQLGVRISFALDADVNIRDDANIMKLLPYAQVYWVRNRRGLLYEKDSPVDKGQDVFLSLYNERGRLR